MLSPMMNYVDFYGTTATSNNNHPISELTRGGTEEPVNLRIPAGGKKQVVVSKVMKEQVVIEKDEVRRFKEELESELK